MLAAFSPIFVADTNNFRFYFRSSFNVLLNDNEMERLESLKLLGVLLDKYLYWKEHIRYTENKVTKKHWFVV